jgi:4'-phosphopantetheinyl transferase EntD
VSGLLAPLLPDGIFGAELFDTGQDLLLAPDEEVLVSGASPKRRRDFAAGRTCARAALEQAGATASIGRAPRGAPIWPPGFVGSITHTDGYAAAIVARQTQFQGAGVDAEQVGRVEEALWPRLFGDDERAWLASRSDMAPMAALLFAAKEAVFKASNPAAGQALHFQSLYIEATDAGHFRLRGAAGLGRYAIGNGLVLACFFVG